jgi:hypothetical protein
VLRSILLACAFGTPLLAGCGLSEGRASTHWSGSADTLASGQIVVHNTAEPIWSAGSEWQAVDELRIGAVEGDGPDVLGQISSFEVDGSGRIWVFEGQSQELRVFDTTGAHVRTIGRRGGGPGEFAQAVRVELGPDAHIWVMDPQNNRLSIFDTAGVYLDAKHALGGFIIMPWPGRFDGQGRYHAPLPLPDGDFRIAMVRYDTSFTATDTLATPRDPVQREAFEHHSGNSRMVAGVPFQGGLQWQLSRAGTIWGMRTDQYRLFELEPTGDTLRTITREFTPISVTNADREQAREDLKWFTDQGGQIDLSKLPSTKPATRSFFFDDEANIWVEPVTQNEETGRLRDVFDREGRFLGTVRLPFALRSSPAPIVRAGTLYGVTHDDLDVPYIVSARIVKR